MKILLNKDFNSISLNRILVCSLLKTCVIYTWWLLGETQGESELLCSSSSRKPRNSRALLPESTVVTAKFSGNEIKLETSHELGSNGSGQLPVWRESHPYLDRTRSWVASRWASYQWGCRPRPRHGTETPPPCPFPERPNLERRREQLPLPFGSNMGSGGGRKEGYVRKWVQETQQNLRLRPVEQRRSPDRIPFPFLIPAFPAPLSTPPELHQKPILELEGKQWGREQEGAR